jgi:hypothetical protein
MLDEAPGFQASGTLDAASACDNNPRKSNPIRPKAITLAEGLLGGRYVPIRVD